MNATATPTGFTQADVFDYARSVRAQLADLGPNVVSELTGGMEADLTEALADPSLAGRDTLPAVFGSPQAYANELRVAAGLPVGVGTTSVAQEDAELAARSVQRQAKWRAKRQARREKWDARRDEWAEYHRSGRLRERWTRATAPVNDDPTWSRFRAWCRELAPLWWALRGWIIGSFLVTAFGRYGGPTLAPATIPAILVALAVTVLSVQWGRGRWLPWRWLGKVATALSIAAVLLALPLYAATRSPAPVWGGSQNIVTNNWDAGFRAGQESIGDGIRVGGEAVNNVFAFDADGNPIPVVQLFDERGRPITLSGSVADGVGDLAPSSIDDGSGVSWYRLPRTSNDGRLWWNTFPVQEVREDQLSWEELPPRPAPGATLRAPQWPFLRSAAIGVGDAATQGLGGTGAAGVVSGR